MRVTLIAVQSLDGFITRPGVPGAGFASAADQAHFRAALRGFDCEVMGRVTFEVSVARGAVALVPTRRRVVVTRDPVRFAGMGVAQRLEFSAITPAAILAQLREAGHHACALLGGAQVYQSFLAAGLVDEIWLTVEARLFGGGTPLLARPTEVRLALLGQQPLGEDALLLKYAVRPKPKTPENRVSE